MANTSNRAVPEASACGSLIGGTSFREAAILGTIAVHVLLLSADLCKFRMPELSSPLTLPCGISLPNRLFKSAMTEGLADYDDRATERHATLYRRWSEGGTGTLVTGNVMIDRRFLERPGNVVIDGNGGEEQLRSWAQAGTAAGNQLWMQISHPGRQCQKVVTGQPMAPSPVPLKLAGMFGRPIAMTESDIQRALDGYARVAGVAKETGFTGVQVHGAHGYLISQFLSPRTNQRDDEWGGSLENRARFLLEAVRRVRAAVGNEFPVALKLNSADFSKGGFSHEESMQVAKWVDEEKLDLLEISGGTYEKLALMGDGSEQAASSRAREAYFLEYAQGIREATSIPLTLTGGFRSRVAMLEALQSGAVDVIGIARPLCTEPDIHVLLEGRMESFEPWERKLRLGPGWLGPTSSNSTLRTLNFAAATQWYYRHLIDLSEGRQPDTQRRNLLAVTLKHTLGEQKFAKRRTFRNTNG